MKLTVPQLKLLRESDLERQRAQRIAATGGPNEAGQALKARVRNGELTQQDIELAALHGDPNALTLIPNPSLSNICQGHNVGPCNPIQAAIHTTLYEKYSNVPFLSYLAHKIESHIEKALPEDREFVANVIQSMRSGNSTAGIMFGRLDNELMDIFRRQDMVAMSYTDPTFRFYRALQYAIFAIEADHMTMVYISQAINFLEGPPAAETPRNDLTDPELGWLILR